MSKAKRRKRKHFLRYLYEDLILLQRDFVIDTPRDFHDAVFAVHEMHNRGAGFFSTRRVQVKMHKLSQQGRPFTMKAEGRDDYYWMQNAQIRGIIVERDGRARIIGRATIGGSFMWLSLFLTLAALFVLVYFAARNMQIPFLQFEDLDYELTLAIMLGALALSLTGTWARMLIDRNYLIRILRDKMLADKVKHIA